MIGRLGRSLGVHLLLASQRLDDGPDHALETHLSYRIGLRTFSAMESRGGARRAGRVRAAAAARQRLPADRRRHADPVQGRVRLRAVPRRAQRADRAVAGSARWCRVPACARSRRDCRSARRSRRAERRRRTDDRRAERAARRRLDQLADQGPPAHQVWLPPLDIRPTLDQLLPRARAATPSAGCDRGRLAGQRRAGGAGRVRRQAVRAGPRPAHGRPRPGAAGTSASPAARRAARARCCDPHRAPWRSPTPRARCSSTAWTSAAARWPRWPACRTSAASRGRLDRDRVSRTVAEVTALLADREQLLRRAGHRLHGDVPAAPRRAGELADEPLRRRLPRRRRLVHAAAGVRARSRRRCARSPPGASTSAST